MLKGVARLTKLQAKSYSRHAPLAYKSYLDIYHASPLERISLIKAGVHAQMAKIVITDLEISKLQGLEVLGLSPATVNRKIASDAFLAQDEGERVIGLAKLIGQVQAMVEESGEAEGFDAKAWLARWLSSPLPAFGGKRPIEFMDTMEGQALVSRTLEQLQTGAYA